MNSEIFSFLFFRMWYNLLASRYLEINLGESALLHVLAEDPAPPEMINCIHLREASFRNYL